MLTHGWCPLLGVTCRGQDIAAVPALHPCHCGNSGEDVLLSRPIPITETGCGTRRLPRSCSILSFSTNTSPHSHLFAFRASVWFGDCLLVEFHTLWVWTGTSQPRGMPAESPPLGGDMWRPSRPQEQAGGVRLGHGGASLPHGSGQGLPRMGLCGLATPECDVQQHLCKQEQRSTQSRGPFTPDGPPTPQLD